MWPIWVLDQYAHIAPIVELAVRCYGVVSPEFAALVASAVKVFGTQKKLAKALDNTDPGYLNQVLKRRGRPFGPMKCIQLAVLMNRSPTEVLRVAGRTKEADWLEEAYGPYVKSTLTAAQRHLLVLWARISPDAQRDLLTGLESLARFTPSTPTRSRRR